MLFGAESSSDPSRSHSRAAVPCLVCSQLPRHEDVSGSDGLTSCMFAAFRGSVSSLGERECIPGEVMCDFNGHSDTGSRFSQSTYVSLN
jgi:hypothetical protein